VFAFLCREESESVVLLKGLSDTGKIPRGALSSGKEGLATGIAPCLGTRWRRLGVLFALGRRLACGGVTAIQSFDEAQQMDAENERMPPPSATPVRPHKKAGLAHQRGTATPPSQHSNGSSSPQPPPPGLPATS
jgi:hypothetical protein